MCYGYLESDIIIRHLEQLSADTIIVTYMSPVAATDSLVGSGSFSGSAEGTHAGSEVENYMPFVLVCMVVGVASHRLHATKWGKRVPCELRRLECGSRLWPSRETIQH